MHNRRSSLCMAGLAPPSTVPHRACFSIEIPGWLTLNISPKLIIEKGAMTSNRKDLEDSGFERIGHCPRPGTLRASLANQLLTRLSFRNRRSAPTLA